MDEDEKDDQHVLPDSSFPIGKIINALSSTQSVGNFRFSIPAIHIPLPIPFPPVSVLIYPSHMNALNYSTYAQS